tara:strand:- start:6742 stop:7239 length:498 start_codon:yes stop_codon:yes gene_type:complete
LITKPIEIGKFGRIHALDGNIRVFSYTHPQDNIFTYQPWHILRNKQYEPITANLIRPIKNGFIVSIKDVIDLETAQSFVDKTIYIDRSELPELKEGHYWHDLLNKKVLNKSNKELGIVSALHDNGAHDLILVKKDDGKLFYIPYLDQYIIRVDEDVIFVDWDHEN